MGFSIITTLLTRLTHRGMSFVWFNEFEDSFFRLTELLSTAPMLPFIFKERTLLCIVMPIILG